MDKPKQTSKSDKYFNSERLFKARNFTVWAAMAIATAYLIAEKVQAAQVSTNFAALIASTIVGLALYFGTKR